MILACERCGSEFEHPKFVGYCLACADFFRESREVARKAARPAPGVHLSGKFLDTDRCPRTVQNVFTEEPVCGLCGCDELENGYGFAGGFGLGLYTACCGCKAILDFSEDTGE